MAFELALLCGFGRRFQHALGFGPVVEDVERRGVGRLLGQRGRVEQLVADRDTRAGAFFGLVHNQQVARHLSPLPNKNAAKNATWSVVRSIAGKWREVETPVKQS